MRSFMFWPSHPLGGEGGTSSLGKSNGTTADLCPRKSPHCQNSVTPKGHITYALPCGFSHSAMCPAIWLHTFGQRRANGALPGCTLANLFTAFHLCRGTAATLHTQSANLPKFGRHTRQHTGLSLLVQKHIINANCSGAQGKVYGMLVLSGMTAPRWMKMMPFCTLYGFPSHGMSTASVMSWGLMMQFLPIETSASTTQLTNNVLAPATPPSKSLLLNINCAYVKGPELANRISELRIPDARQQDRKEILGLP